MSRRTRFVSVMAVVVASIVVASVAMIASAQKNGPDKTVAAEAAARAPDGQCETAKENPEARSMMCPMCPVMSGKKAASEKGGMPMDPQAMMQKCMGMMQQAGVPEEMMRRCQVMMKTPIFLDSPCAVSGQAEALGLSDAQKKRLVEIENEARKRAMAVLTPEQRDKMGKIPASAMAMARVCQQMGGKMMAMMQQMMGGKGPTTMCPMMQKTKGALDVPEGSGTRSSK